MEGVAKRERERRREHQQFSLSPSLAAISSSLLPPFLWGISSLVGLERKWKRKEEWEERKKEGRERVEHCFSCVVCLCHDNGWTIQRRSERRRRKKEKGKEKVGQKEL